MNKLFFAFAIFLFSLNIYAQPQGQPPVVKGELVNSDNEPVPYANVIVYTIDSTFVKGETSDINGLFEIKLRPGNYLLKISFLSYASNWQKVNLNPQNREVNLGKIRLENNSQNLQEVEITAEKSTMELKLDKRVFNVEQDLANAGGDASDVLSNVPSVDVDADGNVSLRGSGGVRILLDGRQSGLIGDGTADALKQIPSDLIDRIEVITNPSARYDAEGEVGIINIILKKEQKKGFNGSVTSRTGWPHNHGVSLNLNWRRKKLNYFVTGGINYRQSPGGGTSNQEFYFPDSTYSFERDIKRLRGGLSENIRGGIDFKLSPKTILTSSVLYSYSNANNKSTTEYRDFAGLSENLLKTSERIDKENEVEHTIEYALNFSHEFENNKDHKLNADIRFINSDDRENSNITEGDILLLDPTINQRVQNLEYEQNLVGQIDYVLPFAKDGKFEAGAKSSFRNLENDFLVENLENGIWETLEPFNNNFIYTENIHAGYIMAGNSFNKVSAQVGLRAEYSDIKTELIETNEVNPRKYLNFFPTAHFSYKLSESNSLQVSYARRIRRPRFWELMPFLNYSDSRNFFSGNPNLNPEYTDSYEMGFLKFTPKGSFFTSVYYRHNTNNIQRITLVDSTGFTRFVPINAGFENAYGLELTGSRKIGKKINLNGNVNLYRFYSEGKIEGVLRTAEATTANGRFMARYNLNKETATQLSMRYRAPTKTLQGRTEAIYSFDFSYSQDLFKNKATLSFNVNDILNSNKRRSETQGDYFFSSTEYQRRQRQFTISFNYRINQKKKQEREGRDGGMDDFDM